MILPEQFIIQGGILEVFASVFGNLLFDIMLIIFMLVGMLVGVFLRPWAGNQVIKLIDREFRFVDFDIGEETSVSVECKPKKGYPPQRYFKWRPGYSGMVGKVIKKPVTRFFGKEGTAYTWSFRRGREEAIKLGKLGDAVKTVLGLDFYEQIPARQQELLEESKIQVTVDLEPGPVTPTGMKTISEEDIKAEEDRAASKTFWKGKKETEKGAWVQWFFIFLAGFGVACALQIVGILRISTPVPAPAPTQEAAAILWSLIQNVI